MVLSPLMLDNLWLALENRNDLSTIVALVPTFLGLRLVIRCALLLVNLNNLLLLLHGSI